MAVKLKEEKILNEWSTLIGEAAGHASEVIDDIKQRLGKARIPGGCEWSLEEVKTSTFGGTRREMLIVGLEQFKVYRHYIGVRDYGAHLDMSRFFTCEGVPPLANILDQQDLRAWVTVVHGCVVDAAHALAARLGQDPSKIRRESKGVLEIW